MARRQDKKKKARAISQAQKQRREEKPQASPLPEAQPVAEASPVPVPSSASLLLTVADLCALLSISRSTLHRMEKAGDIPGRVKLGGQVRYHRQIVEEWLLKLVESDHA